MCTPHRLFAAALAAAAFLLCAASSHAGTYLLYSCQHPDGTAAPTDGWSAALTGGGVAQMCPSDSPHVMRAWLPTTDIPDGTAARLIWTPRGDAVLRELVLRRDVSVSTSIGPGTTEYRLSLPSDEDVVQQCDSRHSCTGMTGYVGIGGLSIGGPNAALFPHFVIVSVQCGGGTCTYVPHTQGTSVAVYWAQLILGDDVAPTFSNVGGSLTSGQPVWGQADITYHATDVGGGIYLQRLVVDGETVVEEVADPNGGRCHDAMPGWGTPYEFDYMLPCAASVDGRIAFDLNRVSVGPHRIAAQIEDAAGNARTIFEGTITVLSDPARCTFDAGGVAGLANPVGDRPGLVPNGAGASRDAKLDTYIEHLVRGHQVGRPAVARATYPSSPTLRARLTAGARPIAGASVSVLQRQEGAPLWSVAAQLVTARDGAVSFRVPRGPSRDLRFAYVPDSESDSFISSRTLMVDVRPRAALRAIPRRLHTGHRVRFKGRVTGEPLPASGLAISLQARGVDSRWLTFKTVHTAADGRLRASYRFTATTGRVRYRFRVKVLRQGGYPFATGYSQAVSVTVQG